MLLDLSLDADAMIAATFKGASILPHHFVTALGIRTRKGPNGEPKKSRLTFETVLLQDLYKDTQKITTQLSNLYSRDDVETRVWEGGFLDSAAAQLLDIYGKKIWYSGSNHLVANNELSDLYPRQLQVSNEADKKTILKLLRCWIIKRVWRGAKTSKRRTDGPDEFDIDEERSTSRPETTFARARTFTRPRPDASRTRVVQAPFQQRDYDLSSHLDSGGEDRSDEPGDLDRSYSDQTSIETSGETRARRATAPLSKRGHEAEAGPHKRQKVVDLTVDPCDAQAPVPHTSADTSNDPVQASLSQLMDEIGAGLDEDRDGERTDTDHPTPDETIAEDDIDDNIHVVSSPSRQEHHGENGLNEGIATHPLNPNLSDSIPEIREPINGEPDDTVCTLSKTEIDRMRSTLSVAIVSLHDRSLHSSSQPSGVEHADMEATEARLESLLRQVMAIDMARLQEKYPQRYCKFYEALQAWMHLRALVQKFKVASGFKGPPGDWGTYIGNIEEGKEHLRAIGARCKLRLAMNEMGLYDIVAKREFKDDVAVLFDELVDLPVSDSLAWYSHRYSEYLFSWV